MSPAPSQLDFGTMQQAGSEPPPTSSGAQLDFSTMGQAGGTPPPPTDPEQASLDQFKQEHPVISGILGAPINVLAGVGAGVEETAAGADVLARRALAHVGHGEMTGFEKGLQREAAKPTEGTMQAIGKGGEAVGEFFTGEELLGMLGRAGQGMNMAQKFKSASQLVSFLGEHQGLARALRIGLDSIKAGGLGGAQEYVKTGGDMGAAEGTGAITAAGTAAMGAAGAGVRALADVAPVKKVLESVPITALKSQVNKFGKFIEGSAEDIAPKIAEQQQQAAHQVIENVAAKATNTALDDINATRSANAVQGPQQPFTFDLGTGHANYPLTDEQAQADRDTIDSLLTKFANPSLRKTITPEEREAWTLAHQRLDAATQGIEDLEPLTTDNPAEAERWLKDRQDFTQTKGFSDLPQAQQNQVQADIQKLQGQLGVYHTSYRQPQQALDKDAILSQVHTFGHGDAQLQAAVRPTLDKFDLASGGKLNGLMQDVQDAQEAIRKADGQDAFDAGLNQLHKANDSIQSLLNQHLGSVPTGEYNAAKRTMTQAAKLGELHAVFENMMNGVTWEESQQGLSRVMTGNAKQFQRWLDMPGNTEMLDSLIGSDSRTNLKELTLLMSKASTNRNSATGAKEIARWAVRHVGPHIFMGGGSAIAGALLAPMFGESSLKGASTGAALGVGMRAVYRLAATNPRFGNAFVYMVKNGLDPGAHAPLLGRLMAETVRPQGQAATPEELENAKPQEQGATQ